MEHRNLKRTNQKQIQRSFSSKPSFSHLRACSHDPINQLKFHIKIPNSKYSPNPNPTIILTLYNILVLYFLIDTKSRRLQANTAAGLSAIARNNRFNQDLIASKQGAVKGLVDLLNSKNPVCQVKAAIAIESLAVRNSNVQRLVEDVGAVKPLIRLLKIWSIEVKEQGTRILFE